MSDSTTAGRSVKLRLSHAVTLPAVCLVTLSAAFWILRIYYWHQIVEKPFSDMADFERISYGILDHFDFSHSAFWRSYKSPFLPVLGAAVFGIFGRENYFAWQCFSSLILFASVLFLAHEIRRSTHSILLPLGLVAFVAFSKASIFWSYKFSTESVSETFLYLIAASYLLTVRRRTLHSGFLTGAILSMAHLTRPNFLPLLPFVGILLYFSVPREMRRKLIGSMAAGAVLIWLPWIVRGVMLYGHPVFTNTSGGYCLIFDLGKIETTLQSGEKISASNDDFLETSASRFKNDYESNRFVRSVFWSWFRDNPHRYFDIFRKRIIDTVSEHTVYLTTVSRTELFHTTLNRILIDKSPAFVVTGFLGLLLLVRFSYVLMILPAGAFIPWFSAIAVQSTSRYLDPMLPLILFGNLVLLYSVHSLLDFYRKRLIN